MDEKDKKELNSPLKDIHFDQKSKKNIPSDVFGSYTGISADGEKPMQDADDI